jgi:hypothetical protein
MGQHITPLDEAEVARWKEAALPVLERWLEETEGQGIDGKALIDRAGPLVAENPAR